MTTAIILAGGLGTRLRKTVPDLPKPMATINGRPFLEILMDYWINQGVTKFILSVGYLHTIITNHFGNIYKGIPVEYSIEESPLGTGGGFMLASKSIHEPFLLINGDTFFEVDLSQLKKFHEKNNSDWTFCVFRTNDTDRYMGMDITTNGKINSLQLFDSSDGCLANGGIYYIEPSIMTCFNVPDGCSKSLENDLLPALFDHTNRIYGLEFSGKFIDIGIPEDYKRASKLFVDNDSYNT